jgi:hypothetical protein
MATVDKCSVCEGPLTDRTQIGRPTYCDVCDREVLPIPDGYCLISTGGNCDAFQRDIYEPQGKHERITGYVLITAAGDPSVPETAEEPVQLGVYTPDDTNVILFDCHNVADAVAIAAKISCIY